jgi:hypothetical protein
MLCHYPLMFYRHDYHEKTIMLCGHVHVTAENDVLEKWREEIREGQMTKGGNRGNIINVGCMMPYMDYTPRTLEEILQNGPIKVSIQETHTET